MANQNGNDTGITFDAAPELEATAGTGTGPAEIAFEAEPATEGKRTPIQQLKEEAGKFGGQASERAKEFAGQGKDRATGALDELTKLIEGAALDVDARLGEQYGDYARSAAKGVSSLAENLRGKEVDDLIADATALVKKSPVIAVGAAAAVGFVIARLVKSGIDAASDAGDPPSTEA